MALEPATEEERQKASVGSFLGTSKAGPRQVIFDALILFILTAILILPLFRIDYFNNWMSIEGSFIADARMIREHWPHPVWHAFWYCGTRFDYIYPPGTRYGAAILSMLLHVIPARGYHVYTGLAYCFGVAGLYFLVRTGSGSRAAGWMAACGSTLVSPSFLLMSAYRNDSLHWMPERLNVLIKWGEGPHTSALAFIPWALAFSWMAFRGGRRWTTAAAAIFCALVVSNNLYGAFALGIFFPVLLWGALVTTDTEGGRAREIWLRAAAIVALSAGLCAWWLTPSFFSLTMRNLILVAPPGNPKAKALALAVVVIFAVGTWWMARRRMISGWRIFVVGSVLFFGLAVLGKFWLDFQVSGDQMRFVPELDLVLILIVVEGLRRMSGVTRLAARLVAGICLAMGVTYVAQAWTVFVPDRNYQQRIEYRMSEWLAKNLPGSRVFATGSLSFWYTTWRDLPQVTGASDQGEQTLMPFLARAQVTGGVNAARDIAWLQALGADAVVMHEANSTDAYPQMPAPRKFIGLLPVMYDAGGDIVYRVPRRPGLARVVDEKTAAGLAPIPWSEDDGQQLRAYADAMEANESQAVYYRVSLREMVVTATTSAGESVAIQENFDPGWRAKVDGVAAPVLSDAMGFMRVRTPPGKHEVRLVYRETAEAWWGLAASIASLLVIVALLVEPVALRDHRRYKSNEADGNGGAGIDL